MNLRYQGGIPEKQISDQFAGWLEQMMDEDERVVYLDADLMGSLKTKELWKRKPDRVFNCGIQEANMVGVAAGLFLAGYIPYIHSFTPFLTRRVYDQLFLSVAYAHKRVHLIGSDAGIMATANGGTHMCFEDIALMRVVPNACIVDVTDAAMFHSLLKETKEWQGVTYFRTARRNAPDVYEEGVELHPGQGCTLTEGNDVTVIASGVMVATALDAFKMLKDEGISARVIDPVTIKPLDKELIIKSAKDTGAVVTVENHSIIGGLGSAVSEVISESNPVPVIRAGINDAFGQTGDESFLRKQYGLLPEDIVEKVRTAIKLKNR